MRQPVAFYLMSNEQRAMCNDAGALCGNPHVVHPTPPTGFTLHLVGPSTDTPYRVYSKPVRVSFQTYTGFTETLYGSPQ